MLVYNYDKNTKEFTFTEKAIKDLVDPEVFLLPAHATFIETPIFDQNYKCIFNEDLNIWILEPIYTIIKADPNPPKYFNYGELTYVTDEEAFTKTETYELIPFTDEEMTTVKNKIWEDIKKKRDTLQLSGSKITINSIDYWFHTDTQSQIQHLGLYESAKLEYSNSSDLDAMIMLNGNQIIWKCMGDKLIGLTVGIVFDLIQADKILMNETFKSAETHKVNVYSSLDPLEYDININWPETYTSI